ncbi:MAG TPA: MraY family glycosyltransferase [Pyrinomonadaceae bacterium]|nr:MraY family glycosyltransferase [Pyrinomonadaceae bacterium]
MPLSRRYIDMGNQLAVFFTSLLASLTLTPVVRRLALRRGWVDIPAEGRKIHSSPVPRVGGIAIFGAVLFSLIALSLILPDFAAILGTRNDHLLRLLVPATIIFFFGLYDDLRGTGAKLKFAVQILAGTLFYLMGGRIDAISVPFVGHLDLPVVLGYAFTVFWIVLVTNALNLIDGMDGLAAGTALLASAIIFVVALFLDHPLVALITLAICGAVTGFLRFNFNPASIFLGDSGSLFIGFMLAALSLKGSQKASTTVAVVVPLMIFGLPLMDTGLAVFRRFINRRPLFNADREHVHHMLLARGLSQSGVALILYGVCAWFGLSALLFVDEHGRLTELILLIVTSLVALFLGRLRYHEIDEIRATAKRQIIDSPGRALKNMKVWRASRAMASSTSLRALFRVVETMLECGEFVYANIQIGAAGDQNRILRAFAREHGLQSIRGFEVKNGIIHWSWERGDVKAEQVVGSREFWSMRLPLATESEVWGFLNVYRKLDAEELQLSVNYLKNSFQREMALAVERVMLAGVSSGQVLPQEERPLPRLAAHA